VDEQAVDRRDVDATQTPRRRVLIVDDDRMQQDTLTRRLRALGIDADAAATSSLAADCLRGGRYDAVLLDLSLGDSDGISLMQALRASISDPAVIIISGLEDRVRTASYRLAEALGLRVAGSLRKPVTQDGLRRLLDALPSRQESARDPATLPPSVGDLAEALRRDAISAQYQPKVSLTDGRVVGVEALARWPHRNVASVPPDVFIPLAEQNGLIVPLTFRILREALEACQRWRARHPACTVAVNISPLVLANPGLPEEIDRLLRDTGLGPGALVAEITESTVIEHPLIAAEVLTRLRIKGVNLSIDDFGTGHSSLLSLLKLPFSELKIDKSFVSRCDVDAEAWKITRATISMARELGLTVVAEGVESTIIATMLRDAGCHVGQGWLFARAMEETMLGPWLDQRARGAA
jgi:EAL domain-containing protein (putative c-di-GMP-specific phosphodiesterase class I)/FixJ family two-component response regulator